ncbi:MAG: Chemotaxis regulator - transmits chemoreceptor signals to flagellar motor components CheY [Candidatus Kapaibacterium sp.]|nr:MAG: Chemotaxis regulator - transmits chemoreceptor signals to flagellar motor components CheY [Candidatus Kapabacteria bacterium]
MKFLVVDDSPTMRRIVINALKSFGVEDIVEAEDGQDALAKLKENKIDFVITDWNMPNMNGLDLTKTIRSSERWSNLPILMVTTRGLKEDIIQALQAKVNNYIVKPFTPQVLKEKILAILKTNEIK